jgi:predicted nucleic acid-binding protein
MVLIDTTVWIDFFADRNEPHVATLQELIENEEDLSLCGVILTEVLQGIRPFRFIQASSKNKEQGLKLLDEDIK